MSELDTLPPPPAALGDLDELRAYLFKVHDVAIDPADPIVMVHTIHRAALEDFGRLLDKHADELAGRVQLVADRFTDDVKKSIETFQSEALTDTLRERLAAMQEAARLADLSQSRFRSFVRIVAALTVVNVLAAITAVGALAIIIQ